MYYVLLVPVRGAIVHAAWICGITSVAGAVTAANRAGWIQITDLAASPKAVAEGRLWLLLTSGVVADHPWLPSLLGFALVGFAFRPDVTALDAEHLVAFALGVAAAGALASPVGSRALRSSCSQGALHQQAPPFGVGQTAHRRLL